MARVMLREDRPGRYEPPSPGLALDEDFDTSVPAVLTPTEGGPAVGTPRPGGGNPYPLVTVRERFTTGRDDNGDLLYSHADTIPNASMIYEEQRREANDKSGMIEITAKMSILYAASAPLISATATLHTSDGKNWTVSHVERLPDRLVFTAHRTENA